MLPSKYVKSHFGEEVGLGCARVGVGVGGGAAAVGGTAVWVGVSTGVTVGVSVGVEMAVEVGVAAGTGVWVGMGLADGLGVLVGVEVALSGGVVRETSGQVQLTVIRDATTPIISPAVLLFVKDGPPLPGRLSTSAQISRDWPRASDDAPATLCTGRRCSRTAQPDKRHRR
jgi:hypothetical protein